MLEADDRKYIWHPFTQMQDYTLEDPLIIEKGRGCILTDIYGNDYIDGVSSLWTNVHGHGKPEIDRAVKEQLDRVAHSTLLGLSSVPAIRFAKQLVEIAPDGLEKVFYSDNGSTAVEISLKMAYQYHQQTGNGSKNKFISFRNAYHGDTIGSVSLGGIDIFHEKFGPLLFETYKAESPYCYRCPFDRSYPSCGLECLSRLKSLIEAHSHEVCAVVIEPLVQGAAGMLIQPPGFLKGVRDLCTSHDLLMIADEVAVGFGKTGKMFACEHEGVSPDLMALSKGISGGYLPLAATLATGKIYQGFLGRYDEFKTFFHGHTYTGNPLACAAALASLQIFREEKVLDGLQAKIARLSERLESFKSLAHVGDVRQKGIMVGIELVADRQSKADFQPELKIGHKVTLEARKHRVIIRPLGNIIVLMPPLGISMDELDRLCSVTFEAIRAVTQTD